MRAVRRRWFAGAVLFLNAETIDRMMGRDGGIGEGIGAGSAVPVQGGG